MTATLDDEVADLRFANAELQRQLDEALAQHAATAEVLQVINSSPGDLTPVFEAMVERAVRLCEADEAAVRTFDGELLHLVAAYGEPQVFERLRQLGPSHPNRPGGLYDQIARGERVTHIADVRETDTFRDNPGARKRLELRNIRTWLAVALRRDGALHGVINVHRHEVRPFSGKQIALLQNFADQAVIAIENARLLTETREALEQQTATAEILEVINRSPSDLGPLFEAIANSSARLCNALNSSVYRFDGELIHFLAESNFSPRAIETTRRLFPAPPSRDNATARAVADCAVVHIPDVLQDSDYRSQEWAKAIGVRGVLSVPMLREGRPIGVVTVNRAEAGPFPQGQVELLKTFADQAVIAIENTRLITETREALEQQTATAEVLQVINSSPGDLAPVFDAMLDKALALCEAAFGVMWRYDGNFMHAAAIRGATPEYAEFLSEPHRPGVGSAHGRLLAGDSVSHLADVAASDDYRSGNALPRALVDLGGGRTLVAVALRKEEAFLGSFAIYRQEVRPFSDKQIALLQNFAAQAVIAIENARLLAELQARTDDLQESLEYQTAISDVLKVISGSSFDIQPVFDTIVATAARLCGADIASITDRDDRLVGEGLQQFHLALRKGPGLSPIHRDYPDRATFAKQRHPESSALPGRHNLGPRVVRVGGDVRDVHDPAFECHPRVDGLATGDKCSLAQDRPLLLVPAVVRHIAIDLALAHRCATEPWSARSRTIVSRAAQLARADEGTIYEFDETEEVFVPKSAFGMSAERVAALRERKVRLGETHLGRAALQRAPVYVEDVQQDPSVRTLPGIHAALAVPLLRNDKVVGGLVIRRRSEAGFAPTIPTLLQTFAGQAVLAIENARLFQELGQRGEEARRARTAAEAALADLRRAQDRLIQAEKMASLGQLTAGIAHEIKNPLNFVNNFAGLSVELLDELKETAAPALAALDDDKRADIDEIVAMLTGNLEKIAEHGRRADGIVKSMLEHSRGDSGERREVDLNNLVEEALNLAYHGARAQDQKFNITLERDFGAGIAPIELAPQEMTRVCLNLFGNGFYAATKRQKEGGDPAFKPTLRASTHDLGEAVEIRIRDNGVGIPPEIRDKLFQPFFTTKPTGEGTGLGLSISWDIVTQQHGGTIAVDSRVSEFTEFAIRLPRMHAAPTAEAAEFSLAPLAGRGSG